MEKFWKIVKGALYAVFILAFLFISSQLFFEKKIDTLFTSFKNFFVGATQENIPSKDVIRVAYPDLPPKLEPVILDPSVRNSLVNVYEPLVYGY